MVVDWPTSFVVVVVDTEISFWTQKGVPKVRFWQIHTLLHFTVSELRKDDCRMTFGHCHYFTVCGYSVDDFGMALGHSLHFIVS